MVATQTLLSLLVAMAGDELKDQVLLKDGRLLEGKLENRTEGLFLTLENGTVRVPDDVVQETCLVNVGAYVPRNDSEKEQLAKGLVLHKGAWISKARYEGMMRQRVDERRKRIDAMRSQQEWSKATTKRTTHFEFKSNCPPDVLDQYVNRLEKYYDHFVKAWGIKLKPGQTKPRQNVSIYRNYASFLENTKSKPGVLGFFNWLDEELHVYWDVNEPELAWSVLFHEGNHLITHLVDPTFHYPNWLNEGMAEYYGASRFEGNEVRAGATHAHRLVELKRDLEKGSAVNAEHLIQSAAAFNANDYRSYNWGWSLVHFLMQTPKYEAKFRKYFLALAIGAGIKRDTRSYTDANFQEVPAPVQVEQFKKMLGISDFAAFNAEWHAYVKALVHELDAKGWFLAARGAFRQLKFDEAVESLRKAFELGYDQADGHYLNAFLMLLKANVKAGEDSILMAIERDPLNARYVGLQSLYRKLAGKDEDAARLMALAKELDPEFDDRNIEFRLVERK